MLGSMNPYDAPKAKEPDRSHEEASVAALDAPPWGAFATLVGIGAVSGAAMGGLLLMFGVTSALGFALTISAASVSLSARSPHHQWPVIAAVALLAAWMAMAIVTRGGTSFRPTNVALSALIAVGPVLRRAQRRAREEAAALRDEDQRVLFRQDLPPPPRAVSSVVRFACSRCREMFDEEELRFVDGERLCVGCRPAEPHAGA
jgi:cation transport ATPase